MYEAVSDWQKLIRVHEVQVQRATDPFQKVDLLHRMARLYEDALGDHEAAFDTLARALPFDDGNEQTLGNLERLAMIVNRWPQLARLYDAELEQAGRCGRSWSVRGARLAQCTKYSEVQLEHVDGAIARYRRVVDLDSENLTALRALDRLYLQTDRWAELATVLAREADIGQSPDDVLELRYRLGQIQQTRLSNLDAAIAAYREVIHTAPDHLATLEALEALFSSGIHRAEVGEILEPLYRSMGEWEKLAQVYEAQLAHTQGQEERLTAYYRLAELFEEKLVDTAQTLDVYVRALKEYPLDEKAGEEVVRLAGHVDAGWETLANSYADILGIHTESVVQSTIGRRLARTFEDELADVGKAEETYKYVLGVDPEDADALANLDRIYLSLQSWPELAQILELRVKSTGDTPELVEMYARLGELYEVRLTDVGNAIRAYRRIFDDLQKSHEGAVAALARIYEQQESWQELDAVYTRELDNASGDAAEAEIRAKIARLCASKLGQPERAIEDVAGRTRPKGRGPGGATRLGGSVTNPHQSQWAKLADTLEREFDIAANDDDRVHI